MNNRTIIMIAMVAVVMMMGHASAAQPVITNVAIPNAAMKVTDVVTATITVNSDAGTHTLTSGTIGGFTLGSLSKVSDTSYTATFTITDSGTDVAAGTDIPVSLILTDGSTPSTEYTTAISQAGDPIDANLPTISAVTIPDAAMKVGDVVTAAITVGDDGEDLGYTLTSGTIGGFTLGSLTRVSSTSYTATFTIADSGTDVAAGSDIPVADLIIADTATNPSATYTTAISQAGDPIDANLPTMDSAETKTTTTIDVTFSEDLDAATVASTDFTVVGSTVSGATESSAGVVTLTLAAAIATDATPVVTLVSGQAVSDVAGNAVTGDGSATYDITPTDGIAPVVASATLNYNDTVRTLVVTFSETIDASETVQAKFHLNNVTGTDNVTLSAAPADVDATTLTFILTEAQRVEALAISGVTGGDGGAVVLDVDAAGVTDMAGNTNAEDDANTVTETPDTTAPTLSSAARDTDTQITVTLSESVTALGANDGGFMVAENGAPLTTYTISAIAAGGSAEFVILTVADMAASGAEGVTVTYTAGGDGTITDLAGNTLSTDATGKAVAAWGAAGTPNITSRGPVSSPVSNTAGATRAFNITVNQSVYVRWLINGTEVATNTSATTATYTNTSAAVGVWNVSAAVNNSNGDDMETWIWNVTAAPAGAPDITSCAPTSPVSDAEGATRAFNVTVNQTATVAWYINGTLVETDADTTTASYTNTSAAGGVWNVSAAVNNANGDDMETWIWNVTDHDIVTIADVTLSNGSTQDVAIQLVNSTGVGGVQVTLMFNQSIVNTTTAVEGDFDFAFAPDYSNVSDGVLIITCTTSGADLTGDLTLATVTLEAVGESGSCELGLYAELAKKAGPSVPSIVSNGTFTIREGTTPPTPASLSSTTGNYWANHTWTAGTGAVTNSYYVCLNGAWTNGTATTFKNTSVGIAGGWANITVLAYNTTGSGNLSASGATGNAYVTPGNGSISGTVTAGSSTGPAVSGASVYAINTSGATIATATTGGDGKYLIPSIIQGAYTLNVSATGYKWNNDTTAVVSAGTANTSCNVILTAEKVTLALQSGETASKIAVAGNETIFNLTATNYGTNATIAVTNSTTGATVNVSGETSTGAAISIGLLNDSESKNFNVTVVHADIGIYQVTITVANTTYGKSASIDLVACMKNATGVTEIGSCNTTDGTVTGNDTILENSNVTSNASVDNSTLSNTNVTQNATVEDSTVLDSSVTGSSSSVVNDAVVNCSTVDNSTVDNTTATDSQLYEGTTVTGSTITGVTANDTTVTGSTVVNVTANGSTITGTTIDTGYAVTLVGATVVDSGGSAQITGGEIVTRGVNFSNVYAATLITDLIIDQIDNTDFAANTPQSIGDIGTVGCNLTVNLTSAGTVNISETAINPDGEGSDVSNSAVIGNFLCIQCNNTSLVQNVTIRMYYTTATSYSGGVYIYHYNTATSKWEQLTTTASGTSGGMNWIEAEPNHLSTFATMGITSDDGDDDGGSSGGQSTYPPSGGGGFALPTATPTATATPAATATAVRTAKPAATKKPAAEAAPAAGDDATPAKPEKKGLLPGFEGVFAIAGLLAIGYVMMRRKR